MVIANPPVTAVVVDWNGYDDTRRCLESLEPVDCAVILVDNGSTEPILAPPSGELIRSETNRGFAGGANLGIRRALDGDAAYIWLLNNDTEVEPATLAALLATAESDPDVGIVGGVLPDAWGGGRVTAWTGVSRPALGPGDRLDYISGACMLVRRAVFEEVGLLDEGYFFYFEDADLCVRARAAGWRLAVAEDARVKHKVGASVTRGGASWADRLQVEASGRFIGKHAGGRRWLGVPVRLAGIALNRARRRELRAVPQLSRALLDGVRVGRSAPSPR